MNRLPISTFITVFTVLLAFCQTWSVAQTSNQRLETFIKFWGFLKYHHHNVATGKQDWDSVYMANVNAVRHAKNKEDFNAILVSITKQLGPVEGSAVAKPADSLFNQNFSLGGLQSSPFINEGLKTRLMEIYDHRHQGSNKYIKLQNMTADFSGEKLYDEIGFPDVAYRLLFLARFYNVINYFAPYKHLNGQDWDGVLRKAIPEIIAATDTLGYYKALTKLAVCLNDGHSQLSSSVHYSMIKDKLFGKYTAPFYAEIVKGGVVITKLGNDSLCRIAGVQVGDVVTAIDHEPAGERIKRLGAYVSASNESSRNHYTSWVLFDTPHKNQQLRILRNGKFININVRCFLTTDKKWADISNYTGNDTGYKTIGNSIAYVYAMQIHDKNVDTIRTLIKNSKAVIFDVRNYPNNDAFYAIFDLFLPEPRPINYSLVFSAENPGYFQWQLSPKLGGVNHKAYEGKVVILADERTQSQGEYSVMALQTIPNSYTVGRQTAGADGVVTQIAMGGRLFISYSGYGIYYPDKSGTQRSGVKIDKTVGQTVSDLQQNKDVVLDTALEYLLRHGIK